MSIQPTGRSLQPLAADSDSMLCFQQRRKAAQAVGKGATAMKNLQKLLVLAFVTATPLLGVSPARAGS